MTIINKNILERKTHLSQEHQRIRLLWHRRGSGHLRSKWRWQPSVIARCLLMSMLSMVWYISKHTKTLSLINFKVKISINLIIDRPVLLYDGC